MLSNNMAESEDISYDDCIIHPDDVANQKKINQINIFMEYYKNKYAETNNTNMFKNIKNMDDTNLCMEELCEHMMIYKDNPDHIDIFDPIGIDFSDYEDLYLLIINNNQELASETLWSLIIYISDKKPSNWKINKVA